MKLIRSATILASALLAAGCSTEDNDRVERVSYPYPVYSGVGSVSSDTDIASGRVGSSNAESSSASYNSVPSHSTTVAEVRTQLQNDPELAVLLPQINFREEAGTVFVTGNVPYAKKQQIETILQRNSNLNVRSELQVSSQSSNDVSKGATSDSSSFVTGSSQGQQSTSGTDTTGSSGLSTEPSSSASVTSSSTNSVESSSGLATGAPADDTEAQSSSQNSISTTNASSGLNTGGAAYTGSAKNDSSSTVAGQTSATETNVPPQLFFGSSTNLNMSQTNSLALVTTTNANLMPTGDTNSSRIYQQDTNNAAPGSKPIDSDAADRQ